MVCGPKHLHEKPGKQAVCVQASYPEGGVFAQLHTLQQSGETGGEVCFCY